MKHEKLKTPFLWKERRILIQDRVWYLPHSCEDKQFAFPGWNDPQVFAIDQPICVEYCSGNGAWIAAKALAHPNKNWVAVERKFPRVQKIWSKIKTLDLPNLLVICGEGHRATHQYFPDHCIESVYINFPDPWPKTRHAKHRIVQPTFVREVKRILKEKGTFTLVTDDEVYSQSMIKDVLGDGGFQPHFPQPFYGLEYPEYGSSYFEDLWRQKGKVIRYHLFQKNQQQTNNPIAKNDG